MRPCCRHEDKPSPPGSHGAHLLDRHIQVEAMEMAYCNLSKTWKTKPYQNRLHLSLWDVTSHPLAQEVAARSRVGIGLSGREEPSL